MIVQSHEEKLPCTATMKIFRAKPQSKNFRAKPRKEITVQSHDAKLPCTATIRNYHATAATTFGGHGNIYIYIYIYLYLGGHDNSPGMYTS
jgi:hypothetical protein